MSELNREQIIKALECCQIRHIANHCGECAFHRWFEPTCRGVLCENALYLIKKLTEENERLRAVPEQLYKEMSERVIEECEIERTLTVRKMQERLMEKILENTVGNDSFAYFLQGSISQIAEEILEDSTDDKT